MELLEKLAVRMRMERMPQVVVVEGEKCATRGDTIFIGEDILKGKKEFLEFMLAHELSHVKNEHSKKKLRLEGVSLALILLALWAMELSAFFLLTIPLVLAVRRTVIELWEIQANVEGAKLVGVRKSITAMEDFTADYRLVDYVLEPLRKLFVRMGLALYVWLYPQNRITALKLFLSELL